MKRISHLVVVAALAFGAQAAWSDDEVNTESLTVAAIDSYGESTLAPESAKAKKSESMLDALGLGGHGSPSRGGPIDD